MSERIAVAADVIHHNDFMRRAILEAYPNAKVYEGPRMNEEQLIEFLRCHAAAIVGKFRRSRPNTRISVNGSAVS